MHTDGENVEAFLYSRVLKSSRRGDNGEAADRVP
jgi:hypothetical protein